MRRKRRQWTQEDFDRLMDDWVAPLCILAGVIAFVILMSH